MRCCLPFCKTTAGIVSEFTDISFHRFPREVHLRAAWLRALGKQDALLPAGAVVCSQHFLDDEIYKTESGSRQIRTGAVPATVLICLICLGTRNQLLRMSEHKLEQAYQHLVGRHPCGGGRLKQTLCVQCSQRLADLSTLRDESLRARRLMTELATDVAVALVAVKREVEHREDADTPAAAKAEAETQAPMKREHTCEPESSEESYQDSVSTLVLETIHGNEEHPTDSSDEWDLFSFENNANVHEDPRKSQDTALIPKELASISDSIVHRTRRNDRFKNKQSKRSQGIYGTQLRNHTDRIQYICDVCQKIFQRKVSLVSHIRAHTFAKTLSCKLRQCKLNQNDTLSSMSKSIITKTEKLHVCELCKYKCKYKSTLVKHMRTHTGIKPFACKSCKYKCTQISNLLRHMRTHTGEKPFACKLCKYKCTQNSDLLRHMRTHTGEMPFACKLCKYKCAAKSNLVRHMRTH